MTDRKPLLGAALLLLACSGDRPPVHTPIDPTPRATAEPSSTVAPSPAPSTAAAPALASQPAHSSWPPTPPSGIVTDFCIETVSALDEETCYVLPDAPTSELLLYLHGIVPPTKSSKQKTNFETVVANASKRAGVAALMPRGRRGLAPRAHADWWGWPTSREEYLRWTKKMVVAFAEKRGKLEKLVGQPFTRLYVAGSSSGAYFAVGLALNGELQADGFAAISGGAARASAPPDSVPRKPFYIGYGTRDSVGDGASALAKQLENAKWPVMIAAHPLPHGTAEVYLDQAFAFWREGLNGAPSSREPSR